MTTTEPTPLRDNGPYATPGQARAQFEATAYGIPSSVAGPPDLTALIPRGSVADDRG